MKADFIYYWVDIELRFYINSDALVGHLHENSMVARRQVYDGICCQGGALKSACKFRFWYQNERKRKEKLKDENGIGEERLAKIRISEL